MAWFADGGRGARLSAALRLDLDPHTPALRRAVEVYPHAATVALFGLPKTLKYKQKPGRDVIGLRADLSRLMDLLESLRAAEPSLDAVARPQWTKLKTAVAQANREVAASLAEDPVDAVVCAYIAHARTRPDDVTVYGDPATGCIVTPTLKAVSRSRP